MLCRQFQICVQSVSRHKQCNICTVVARGDYPHGFRTWENRVAAYLGRLGKATIRLAFMLSFLVE